MSAKYLIQEVLELPTSLFDGKIVVVKIKLNNGVFSFEVRFRGRLIASWLESVKPNKVNFISIAQYYAEEELKKIINNGILPIIKDNIIISPRDEYPPL